ncbi:agmatinase [Paraburkholderia sp. BR10882]|uniref:agmatinase n=1 Tax=unclassified Paraburkholderia TaxID=2615204 RepID=UPI0034CF24AF
MAFDGDKLAALREKFGGANEMKIYDPHFNAVAANVIDKNGTRYAPFAGVSTFLDVPLRNVNWEQPELDGLDGLDVAILGVPMDLGVSNRNGARFGPRSIRTIERIGPYNHVLKSVPTREIAVADIGDVPFRSRFDLLQCHRDIEKTIRSIVAAGVIPLSVGGDHSVTLPILRALGERQPVGLVHIDAHCDTGGPFDDCKFHHGGPFRHAVLEGVLDPTRTIQIGIRGAAEYHWEFSYESGMTVVHAEDIHNLGIEGIVAKARKVIGDGPVYISYDIDSLDPAFAPGTGTPEVGGLTVREAQAILRGLAGLNVVGGDVVEVAPQYDATTNTAHAGAQILFEILSLICASRRA